MLRQHDRENGRGGRVIASLDDYATARELLSGPLDDALGKGAEASSLLKKLRAEFPDAEKLTTSDVTRAKLFGSKPTTIKKLDIICKAGFLKKKRGLGNKANVYRFTGAEPEAILPSVASVKELYAPKGRKS